mmetsp:Transcript_102785/g.326717  ORF Transcript_102785/g.326717 Transcript_102785/m.326717 type:complete len:235 (-) Transcript_102785:82-786(-)
MLHWTVRPGPPQPRMPPLRVRAWPKSWSRLSALPRRRRKTLQVRSWSPTAWLPWASGFWRQSCGAARMWQKRPLRRPRQRPMRWQLRWRLRGLLLLVGPPGRLERRGPAAAVIHLRTPPPAGLPGHRQFHRRHPRLLGPEGLRPASGVPRRAPAAAAASHGRGATAWGEGGETRRWSGAAWRCSRSSPGSTPRRASCSSSCTRPSPRGRSYSLQPAGSRRPGPSRSQPSCCRRR